jgi:Zn-dependent metalloprotease
MTKRSLSRIAITTFVALVLASPVVRSQQLGAPDAPRLADDAAVALETLRDRGMVRHVRIAQKSGRVAAAYGDLGTLPSRAAKSEPDADAADAVAFLAEVPALVGAADPSSEFVADRRVETPIGTHVRLRQRVGEYPVFGATAEVHADRDGRVYALTSGYEPNLDPALAATHPALDERAAFEAARAALAVDPSRIRDRDVAAPELGVAAEGRGRLAWRVVVPVREPYEQWQVFVDATTGEIVGSPESMVVRAGRGRIFVPNAVVTTGNVSLEDNENGAVSESAYTDVELPGLDASGFLTGPYCTTDRTDNRVSRSTGDFSDLRRSDAGFNEVEVYWAIDMAQRYIQGTLGIDDAANYSIRVDAHAYPDDNSNYSLGGNGTGVLNFGDGGVDDAQDAEIVWHEYGHAILDNQAQIRLSGESGAIHEGWGDYVAATMSTRVAGDSRFYTTIGEWDAVVYNPGNPAFLRRVDTTKRYPDDLRFQVHTDGEIWSSCLWGIHQALGRDVANRIIFNANFLFPTDVGFEDAAAAVMESDRQLNGGANALAIRQAFASHGIQVQVTGPVVSSVRVKKSKLVVDGAEFETNNAIVEIDGVAYGALKYPQAYRRKGVSRRILSKDGRVASLQAGVTYQVTVFNPVSGLRSAPFAFTR